MSAGRGIGLVLAALLFENLLRGMQALRGQFRGFAQILGKLDFFNLGENLQRILFDYVEKRASTANAPFNRPC
jgi:hypothetical protein